MDIKILESEEVEFKEKDVQQAFEHDLGKLEEGLDFVASEVIIGTGRIDTLAIDTNTGQPVFVEYKRRGEFNKDALVQLMDYLSWFARDQNRMSILEKTVRKHKPGIEDFEPSIRLICVVTDIDDRVRNAIYAIANHVKVISYLVARDTASNVVLVPRLEVDNAEVERQVGTIATEAELLNKYPHLQKLFNELRLCLEKDGADSYTTRNSFRFRRNRLFAKVGLRRKYIQLELRVGKGAVVDTDFKYWRQGDHDWGYVHIYPSTGVSEKVLSWIDAARGRATESGDEDENIEDVEV